MGVPFVCRLCSYLRRWCGRSGWNGRSGSAREMAREAPHFCARRSYPSFGDVRVCRDVHKISGGDARSLRVFPQQDFHDDDAPLEWADLRRYSMIALRVTNEVHLLCTLCQEN